MDPASHQNSQNREMGPQTDASNESKHSPRSIKCVPDLIIKIDQSTTPSVIDGAPLIIEFDKVFDRPANPPNEHDVVFSGQDLAEWASWLWVGL